MVDPESWITLFILSTRLKVTAQRTLRPRWRTAHLCRSVAVGRAVRLIARNHELRICVHLVILDFDLPGRIFVTISNAAGI
jgi:hypothetical protein